MHLGRELDRAGYKHGPRAAASRGGGWLAGLLVDSGFSGRTARGSGTWQFCAAGGTTGMGCCKCTAEVGSDLRGVCLDRWQRVELGSPICRMAVSSCQPQSAGAEG